MRINQYHDNTTTETQRDEYDERGTAKDGIAPL